MKRWKDEVAVITGASSGIGRATALAFAEAGARVAVSDVQDTAGEQIAREIRERGSEAVFIHADVSQASEASALIEKVLQRFGRLDFAFNNAGIEGEMATTVDCTEQNFDRVIAVNLKGIWLCMRSELEQMLKRGVGAIVNCSSVAGLVGFPQLPAYAASKHGVIGLTRAAALECGKSGVRINAVCPGAIRTPMLDRIMSSTADMNRQLVASEPIGRLGKPEEIGKAVVWLCSDDASFVTGHALAVDGGWVAQ